MADYPNAKMADTYALYVKYNAHDRPRISIWRNPGGTQHQQRLNVDPGMATITWLPVSDQVNAWTFEDLVGLPRPPFSEPVVQPQSIEVEDQNDGESLKSYPYTIKITVDGETYSHDPQIRNKPS